MPEIRNRRQDASPSPKKAGASRSKSPAMKRGSQRRAFPAEPSASISLLLGLSAALFVPLILVIVIEGLPPILTADRSSPFGELSAQRVRENMQEVCALGTRLVGSEANEVRAVEYLSNVLVGIQAEAHDGAVFEVAKQYVSGAFNTDFLGGVMNVYENVTNVMCRYVP